MLNVGGSAKKNPQTLQLYAFLLMGTLSLIKNKNATSRRGCCDDKGWDVVNVSRGLAESSLESRTGATDTVQRPGTRPYRDKQTKAQENLPRLARTRVQNGCKVEITMYSVSFANRNQNVGIDLTALLLPAACWLSCRRGGRGVTLHDDIVAQPAGRPTTRCIARQVTATLHLRHPQ